MGEAFVETGKHVRLFKLLEQMYQNPVEFEIYRMISEHLNP